MVERLSLHQSDPWWPCSGLLLVGPCWFWWQSWFWLNGLCSWYMLKICCLFTSLFLFRPIIRYTSGQSKALIPHSLQSQARLSVVVKGRKAIIGQVYLSPLQVKSSNSAMRRPINSNQSLSYKTWSYEDTATQLCHNLWSVIKSTHT